MSLPEEDHDKFVKLVLEEFKNLHEGNALRFGVHPPEFTAWQEKVKYSKFIYFHHTDANTELG